MKKLAFALGAAALATITGCKDPDYVGQNTSASDGGARNIDTTTPSGQAPGGAYRSGTGGAYRPGAGALQPGQTAPTGYAAPGAQPGGFTAPVAGGAGAGGYAGGYAGGAGAGGYATPGTPPPSGTVTVIDIGAPGSGDVSIDLQPQPYGTYPGDSAPGAPIAGTPGSGASGSGAGRGGAPSGSSDVTYYIVQRGDYLAKISKRYNIKVDAIRRLNNLPNDTVRIGQKIKLPGSVDVGEQRAPEGASAHPPKPRREYRPYSGATKEYVVRGGDTLGAIAYSNGINIRQLKELNGLKSDFLRVGQHLQVPAEKVVRASAAPSVDGKGASKPKASVSDRKPSGTKAKSGKPKARVQPSGTEETSDAPPADDLELPSDVQATAAEGEIPLAASVVASGEPVGTAADAAGTTNYTVQEGDDMTSVSISFGVTSSVIRELNNLSESDQLKPGQVIKIPAEAQ